jgi:phosphosulfolactate phosphohydrolase-like enzyme
VSHSALATIVAGCCANAGVAASKAARVKRRVVVMEGVLGWSHIGVS